MAHTTLPSQKYTPKIHMGRAAWTLGIVLAITAISISFAIGAGTPNLAAPINPTATAPAVPAVANPTTISLNRRYAAEVKPFLEKNCYSCHGNGKSLGDMSLDPYTDLRSVQIGRERWAHVSRMIKQNLMPPEGRRQPPQAEKDAVVAWIEEAVNFCDCTGPKDPGRVAIHRLNRNEYNNTIRDLLGVDFKPANDFPVDDSGYGFDNIADVLSMSPLLAEKYLNAAEQSTAQLFTVDERYKQKTVRLEGDAVTSVGDRNRPLNLVAAGGSRIKFDFPVKGTYEIRVSASQQKVGTQDAQLDWTLGNAKLGTMTITGTRDKPSILTLKINAEAGSQTINATFTNPLSQPAIAPAPATAPGSRPATRPAGGGNRPPQQGNNRPPPTERSIRMEYIEIDGPIAAVAPPSAAYAKIFVAKPSATISEDSAATTVLSKFATRAFRRPVEPDEIGGLFKVYKAARTEGDSWEQSVRAGLQAALCSPKFLFRIEVDPAVAKLDSKDPKPYNVSDYELAARLSYFLWSSMPDDELIAVAASQKLRDPATLEKQVLRMLKDLKAAALVQNFPGQWLELRNLADFKPDTKIYPTWDDELREAMETETELFFENLVKEDRSIIDLLTADYTFVNEKLASHYGIGNVKGKDFRKVSLAGTKRAGILTQGSILAVTAFPTRTSPVKRGKFILTNVLGMEIPPPPPDVPTLSENPKDTSRASLRERLEEHRKNPNCSVCHITMDNIGFSLENYDSIGRYRDKDGNFPIDSLGKMPDGTQLAGAEGLRKFVVSRQSEFATVLTKKLLTYALGRGLEYYDDCSVKDIELAIRKDGYKFSSLVLAIVKSEPFQKRRMLRPEEISVLAERIHEIEDENRAKQVEPPKPETKPAPVTRPASTLASRPASRPATMPIRR